MEIAANILAVLLALLFLMHGITVLRGHEMQVQTAEVLGWPYERYRLVAIPEIAAGLGLLAGFWVRWLAAAAAFGLVVFMLCAAVLRARVKDEPRNVIGDVVLALIALTVGIVQVLAI